MDFFHIRRAKNPNMEFYFSLSMHEQFILKKACDLTTQFSSGKLIRNRHPRPDHTKNELILPIGCPVITSRLVSTKSPDYFRSNPVYRQTYKQTNEQDRLHNLPSFVGGGKNKELSCRREAAQCFISLNISISDSRSLKVIRNGAA